MLESLAIDTEIRQRALPRARELKPDPKRLEERYEMLRKAG